VIRLRLDSSSGHHDSMLMKAWIHTRQHFTSEVCERAIPTSTTEGCYPMLIRQRECHSYYRDVHYYVIICPASCLLIGYDAFRLGEKINVFNFRRSQIEAELKSNRSRIVILITTSQSNRSRIEVESHSNCNCNSRLMWMWWVYKLTRFIGELLGGWGSVNSWDGVWPKLRIWFSSACHFTNQQPLQSNNTNVPPLLYTPTLLKSKKVRAE